MQTPGRSPTQPANASLPTRPLPPAIDGDEDFGDRTVLRPPPKTPLPPTTPAPPRVGPPDHGGFPQPPAYPAQAPADPRYGPGLPGPGPAGHPLRAPDATPSAKKRPSVVMIVLFIVLGLLVLAGIVFGAIWFMGGLHLSAVPITVLPRA